MPSGACTGCGRKGSARSIPGSRHTGDCGRTASTGSSATSRPCKTTREERRSTDVTSALDPTTQAPPRAGRREWIGLAVLALACLLYVMDLTVLHLAVPSISETLKPTSAQLLWIIDIYGFMVAGFLVTMGTLGDRIGRPEERRVGEASAP